MEEYPISRRSEYLLRNYKQPYYRAIFFEEYLTGPRYLEFFSDIWTSYFQIEMNYGSTRMGRPPNLAVDVWGEKMIEQIATNIFRFNFIRLFYGETWKAKFIKVGQII